MGVAAQAGHALAAAFTARSTAWWAESGTREMTEPSPGLKTSMAGSDAEDSGGAPEMTFGTVGYFMLQRYRNRRTTNSNGGTTNSNSGTANGNRRIADFRGLNDRSSRITSWGYCERGAKLGGWRGRR